MLLFSETFLCTYPWRGLFSKNSALDFNFLGYVLGLYRVALTEGRQLYVHFVEVHFQLAKVSAPHVLLHIQGNNFCLLLF